MRIALIGYGRMGQEIEKIALSRGHEIVLIIDIINIDDFTPENIQKAQVAIAFTIPESAVDIYCKCFENGVPVVSGTTGWLDRWDEVVAYCSEKKSAFFYASNFSLGVNVFFELNKKLANFMKPFSQYKATMTEVHHTRKLDSPSGTAISLAEDLIGERGCYDGWVNELTNEENKLGIISVREGDVPGIHTITYNSDVDFIEIKHSAKNRSGFAFGAVLAAEFILGKTGILSMKDLLKFDELK
jgi:4-hydroxy-tetrahydrodipicolinate reductase